MRAQRSIMGILSSKEMLLWLGAAWIVYYVTSAFLISEAFATFVLNLRESLPVRIAYILFLVCATLNVARAFRERRQEGSVYAIASMVLPLGVVVFLLGFLLSGSYRQLQWTQVGQGQEIKPKWSRTTLQVGPITPALDTETLSSEEDSELFAYEPKVVLFDGRREYEVGAFPPTKIGDTYVHVLNFGLAPGFSLSDGRGTMEEGYMMLKILPPGKEDTFDLRGVPYRFSVRIMPEKVLERGGSQLKLYNLGNLQYRVEVTRGENTVYDGDTVGGGVRFEGMELSFFEPAYWVQLELVRDPGRAVLLWGIAIVTLGVPLWLVSLLLMKRRED